MKDLDRHSNRERRKAENRLRRIAEDADRQQESKIDRWLRMGAEAFQKKSDRRKVTA